MSESRDADRFSDIMEEIWSLAKEAVDIARANGCGDVAESYWYPHIVGAVNKEESGYTGGSMVDMAQTLETMRGSVAGEGDAFRFVVPTKVFIGSDTAVVSSGTTARIIDGDSSGVIAVVTSGEHEGEKIDVLGADMDDNTVPA